MPKEGNDKEEKKKSWPDNFKGKVIYDKDGVRVFKSDEMPFKVAILPDGSKKIVPEKVDVKTIDFTTLPDVDTKDLDKNIKTAQLYGLPQVDNNVRQAWNDYVGWLKDKGYSGNPEMNHKAFSDNAFAEYKKENPNTILTPDYFLPIQYDIHNYRNHFIDDIKAGKENLNFTPNEDYSNVMEWASKPLGQKMDGFVGQQTSQFLFPSQYMNDKTPENRIGFVPPPDEQQPFQQNTSNNTPQIKTGKGIFYGGKRIGELFPVDNDNSVIRLRNDYGLTGNEVQLPNSDLPKYIGTTNAIQSPELYKEFTSKATSTAKK